MSKLFNRAKMTTTTTGTGDLTLGSAASGFVTFATAGVVNGDVVRYCIEAENGTDFEIGEGSYTASGTVLSRADADVQLSSNSNNRITLAAGTHNVFITAADSDFTQEIIVTVANAGAGNKYVIDGTSQQIITLLPSITYRLDQSDSSNATHPLVLASGSADGSTYSTGVRTVGTPGSKGAYTEVKLEQDAPALFYKCSNHSGMGNSINLAAPVSGAASAVGTLTKTFTQNEEASITLSSAISPVPNVSVFKEIPQVGISSKGTWDVDATATNYTRLDEATSVTLTPSAVGDGTFSLGSGSFSSADVGKTITGNGGVAVLTSAAGAYVTTTDFTNTNAIAAGAWDMHGSVAKSDGSGLTVSSFVSTNNLVNKSGADVSSYKYRMPSYNLLNGYISFLSMSEDGTILMVAGGTPGAAMSMHRWNLSTAYDFSTASYVNASTGNSPGTYRAGGRWSQDGTKLIVGRGLGYGDQIISQTASAWSTTRTTASTVSLSQSSGSGEELKAMSVSPDGQYIWIARGGYPNDNFRCYSLSTAWDVSSTKTLIGTSPQNDRLTGTKAMQGSSDGKKLWTYHYNNNSADANTIYEWSLSTAWDPSTISPSGNNVYPTTKTGTLNSGGSLPAGWTAMGANGKFWVDGGGTKLVFMDAEHIAVIPIGSTSFPASQYFVSVTDSSGQIDTSSWTDINSMTADETAGGGTLSYAISTDNHAIWKVIHNTNGVRSIAKNNSGTWQVNTNATYASETWSNATTNNELSALQQAMATTQNRMNKTQLDAVTDANHIPLGSTLDLMIAPYMASAGTAPISDGVTINYDASAINRQAINGTDYEAEFPSSTSVKIKSLAAHNLKIRVL